MHGDWSPKNIMVGGDARPLALLVTEGLTWWRSAALVFDASTVGGGNLTLDNCIIAGNRSRFRGEGGGGGPSSGRCGATSLTWQPDHC